MPLEDIAGLLQAYGYLLLFPVAIMEGPIVTVIAGFLVSLGVFNPLIVYAVVVLGDVLGDAFWYTLGRIGGNWRITRAIKRLFKISEADITYARRLFETHRYKMMTLSKLAWGLGSAGLLAAGLARVPYSLFFTTCVLITLGQAAFFLGMGVLFGETYSQIAVYLDHFGSLMLILFIALIGYALWRWRKRLI